MSERVKFYSASDWSRGYHLQLAENILLKDKIDSTDLDINDAIELHNIFLFFENNVYLNTWSDEIKAKYRNKVKSFKGIIGNFFARIYTENLISYYEQIEIDYLSDFWELFAYYNVYKRISGVAIQNLINKHKNVLRDILHQKKLVIEYETIINDLLTNDVEFAELVLNYYLVKQSDQSSKMYIPQSFGAEKQKILIRNYIEWDRANPNYLQLLASLKKHDKLITDDRIRFAAHNMYQKRMEELLSDKMGEGASFGIEVCFYDDSTGDGSSTKKDPGVDHYSYGTSWFIENLDYPTVLNNFIYVFGFVDSQFRYTYLSNPSHLGFFEDLLGVHAVREYSSGINYQAITMLSCGQMKCYIDLLKNNGITLENIFKWFFEIYLKDEFGACGFVYNEPSEGAIYLEKILLLISQIDSIVRQYRFYVDDGLVNRKFLEFSTQMYLLSDSPSMSMGKYVYPNSEKIKNVMSYLYSNQSMLAYTDSTRHKYKTLPELLINELIYLEDFPRHSQSSIQWLIENGYLYEDINHRICVNIEKAYILKDLFDNGVISKSYYSGELKVELENMIRTGDLILENTLFTRQEQDYIDYILNVQRFNNGPEIRNKYVHGTYPLDQQSQEQDYIELLKIMVLLIIKINEEFCLKDKFEKEKSKEQV